MSQRLCLISATLLLALLPLAACAPTPKAPVALEGDYHVHDPGFIKQGDSYYVFSTGEERGFNNGNVQIRRSKDLVTWERIGTVFETIPPWITEALGGTPPNLWAPDIAFLNGKYYLYYAGSRFGSNNSVIGLATNATLDPGSADYKWLDEGLAIRSGPSNNWNAIDPNLSFDAESNPWLSFGSFWDGIKMVRVDKATGKPSTTDTTLYALASRGGGPIEAPAIIFRDGYYYLFVSFDLCCRGVNSTYKIMVGRAKVITGPYLDRENKPLAEGGGTLVLESNGRYHGPGGQTVYLENGTYRLINHYYDTDENGTPKLQIHDLNWASDGWPGVGAR